MAGAPDLSQNFLRGAACYFSEMTPAERLAALLPAGRRDEVLATAAVLDGQLAAIAAAWPRLGVDAERYLAKLAEVIERRGGEPLQRVIERMPAADLYLAAACAQGDPAALAVFRDELLPSMRQALGALAIPPETIAEAEQRVLVMLFVGPSPQIAGYTGRGRLRSWLRSVGVRTGRRLAGILHGAGEDDSEIDDLPAAVRDPELDMFRARYADEVRRAFVAALDALTDRQRLVLRQYYLDGLTIDQLATLYKINRATAARWVAGARLAIITNTRTRLIEDGVPESEVDSIIRLVRSQLTVSLRHM